MGGGIPMNQSPASHATASWPEDDRFRIMADCSPVMLWMAGTDARCYFFNQPWLHFTGRSLEEEFGYGWCEGVHPEDFQVCVDTYMEAFHQRREFSMEYRLLRADGVYRWILDNGKPYWNAGGSFAGFIGSCIDITNLREAGQLAIERARLEARVMERERVAATLAAANKELEAFAYTVSHDLRAPLRAIDGFVRILSDEPGLALSQEARECFGMIRENVQQMGKLIEDLLRFSKSSRQPLRRQKIEPGVIAQRVKEKLRTHWQDRSIEFVIRDVPSCEADPDLFAQVLFNLLDNAIKFTRRQPAARIEFGSVPQNMGDPTYFIADNGAGFDMKQADKLFGVFQRLHSDEDFEGTGAGLAIAQRIILRHGGRIWVDAAPNLGATFYFTIPEPVNTHEPD
jgi:PAS domain S-box-containing protein